MKGNSSRVVDGPAKGRKEMLGTIPIVGGHRNLGTEPHLYTWKLPVTFFICNGRCYIRFWHLWDRKSSKNIRQMCPGVLSSTTERTPQWSVLKLSTSWSISSTSPVAEFFLTLARMLISYENVYWRMRWKPSEERAYYQLTVDLFTDGLFAERVFRVIRKVFWNVVWCRLILWLHLLLMKEKGHTTICYSMKT